MPPKSKSAKPTQKLTPRLQSRLATMNKRLYPAKLRWREDSGKFFIAYRRKGRNVRKVLSDDLELAYEQALLIRKSLDEAPVVFPTPGHPGTMVRALRRRTLRQAIAENRSRIQIRLGIACGRSQGYASRENHKRKGRGGRGSHSGTRSQEECRGVSSHPSQRCREILLVG